MSENAIEDPMPSNVIRSFSYDAAKRELHVVFQSGRRYTYLEVPEATFHDMKASFSKGEFFSRSIRSRYRFVHLGPQKAGNT